MTITNNKLRHRVSRLPSPMAGLALAIASLGWAWESMVPNMDGRGQLVGASIASVLLLMLVAKFVLHPQVLIEELTHPVIGSVIPTFAMGLMVVSAALGQFNHAVGVGLWLLAIVIHIVFLTMFVYYRAIDFKLEHMVPSWFVPPIGIIVAAVSFPHGSEMEYQWLANAILTFGMTSYLVMLPIMLYRLIFCAPIADAAKPTIAILAAPASLSLAGYLTISNQPSLIIVGVLLTLALLMTSVIYLAFFHLLRLPFSPGYAAFTFPMVIGATALFKTVHWLVATYGSSVFSFDLLITAKVELIVATLVVTYVVSRYLYHYKSSFLSKSAQFKS
ncbi:TDT family transporter [Shewanella schlegeliana]|uniref:TDT family transporter n=1 Tax=Shewanella schlegeliana TaxID=190308 RepID=A0ABS1T0L5_9GAMM|nr:TDT family transporter [Shewanella schlegeliana]MBL4913086.1 TDT family transporter [Shewanella schlegeliana]MCL1111100.1 TDT family transporter [Shewanella schlegeliana]GIU28304.1 C4-dicarboxylate ABC transporter [Shewanella schlegeliana]